MHDREDFLFCLPGYGVAVLAIGMSLRMVASFLAVFGLGFTWKEKFFIPFAWLPKATVQVNNQWLMKRIYRYIHVVIY